MQPALITIDARPSTLQFLWRELRIGVPLCFAVAGFLSLVFRDPFGITLLYSLCIGLLIQAVIQGGRYAMVAVQRRLSTQADTAAGAWPGWHWMAPWIAVSVPLGYVAGMALADLLTHQNHTVHLIGGSSRTLAVIFIVSIALSASVTYFFYSRGRIASIEAAAEAARRAAAENQLKLLESQLEPHMLFNTLANLRVLIGLDAPRAQAMLDHLIAFLRATLQASRTGSHTLAEEFQRINDYLALMQVRMGPRLTVSLTLPDSLRALPVPTLLLQPLVENAILHGLEPKIEGGHIEITAQAEGPQLVLSVRDTGVGLKADRSTAGTGFGTTHVTERLRTLFGDQAELSLRPANDAQTGALAGVTAGTVACVRMPVRAPSAQPQPKASSAQANPRL